MFSYLSLERTGLGASGVCGVGGSLCVTSLSPRGEATVGRVRAVAGEGGGVSTTETPLSPGCSNIHVASMFILWADVSPLTPINNV